MYILFFSLLVSFDAFVCGLSLRISSNKQRTVLCVYSTIVSFIGSLVFSVFGVFLMKILDVKTASVCGGILLILISLFSLLENCEIIKNNLNKESADRLLKFIACSVVAADASFAALSFSLMGNRDYFYIAAVFGIMHGLMVLFGSLISENKFFKKIIIKSQYLPTVILFFLGLSKLF